MKLFRQFIEEESLGFFVADATHKNGVIQTLTVYPIRDGMIMEPLGMGMSDLQELVDVMQTNLTDCLENS